MRFFRGIASVLRFIGRVLVCLSFALQAAAVEFRRCWALPICAGVSKGRKGDDKPADPVVTTLMKLGATRKDAQWAAAAAQGDTEDAKVIAAVALLRPGKRAAA